MGIVKGGQWALPLSFLNPYSKNTKQTEAQLKDCP